MIYHPINITTGQWQEPEEVKARLEKHVEEIASACREAELSESSQKRVRKAKGTFTVMVGYLIFFFHILADEERKVMREKAEEAAGLFQRSSSCVEGRNAWLRMKHEGCHRLSDRKLKALTVLHNYHIRRQDETTPARRFFGKDHINLFEWLVAEVPMLGWPRKIRQKLAA